MPNFFDPTFDFDDYVESGGRFMIDPQFSLKKPRTILVIEYHDPANGWQPVKWWPAAGVPRTLENARAMSAVADIPDEKSLGFRIIQRTFTSEEYEITSEPTLADAMIGVMASRPLGEEHIYGGGGSVEPTCCGGRCTTAAKTERAAWTRDIARMLREQTAIAPELRPGYLAVADWLDPECDIITEKDLEFE